MEREIRRNQNNLIILGTGVLAFAVWTVVRSLIQYMLQSTEIKNLVSGMVAEDQVNWVMTVIVIIIVVTLAVDLILRMIVGFSARAEGKGKKKRLGYLVAAVILIVVHVLNISQYIMLVIADTEQIMECIIGAIIEVTSVITLLQLIIASVRFKKLTAQKSQ